MKKYIIIFTGFFVGSLIIMLLVLHLTGFFEAGSGSDIEPLVTVPTGSAAADDEHVDSDENDLPDRKEVVNILAFGMNSGLADTIILFSYNTKLNKINVLSIPRDTYHHVVGFEEPWLKKINAVYTYREKGGVLGMKKEVSNLLQIPVHHYVKVEFESVVAVVDMLGGYKVYVPYDMVYDDENDHPPLHINIKKGEQVLNGLDTLKYLRFRKNNDGTINEGDIPRTKRQQHFVSSMLEKILSSKIVSVMNTIIKGNYISTDIEIDKVIELASKASKLTAEDINMHYLEGKTIFVNSLSYWKMDEEKVEEIVKSFYDDTPEQTEEENQENQENQEDEDSSPAETTGTEGN